VLVAGGLVWLIYFLAVNTAENLELRGMLTGFGFLSVTAGFDADFTLIGYRLGVETYGRIFIIAILNTLFIAFFFGSVLAGSIGSSACGP
jgi:general L-amino acid transport system permease protein